MDLKEFKRLASFARKSGIKSLKLGDAAIEFHESALNLPKQAKPSEPDKPLVSVPSGPTLDEINEYIYGKTDEVA